MMRQDYIKLARSLLQHQSDAHFGKVWVKGYSCRRPRLDELNHDVREELRRRDFSYASAQLFSTGRNNNENDKRNSEQRGSWLKKELVWLGAVAGASGGIYLLWLLQKRFDDIVGLFESNENRPRFVYPFDPGEVEYFFKKHCLHWFPKRFTSTPIAWEYLQELGRGGERRDKAIEIVSHMKDLSESECLAFAMGMELKDAIAIAHNGGDSRIFPPPPVCIGPHDDYKAYYGGTFRNIVANLPESNIHYNLNFIFRSALETYLPSETEEQNQALDLYTGFDESPKFDSTPPEISEDKFLKISLQAVVSHTRDPDQIKLISKNEILEALMVITSRYKENVEIHSLVLKVMANLSRDSSYTEDIRSTGCLSILAAASNDTDIKLVLPAKRALHNLDREAFPYTLASGVYQLYPDTRTDESKLEYDVVFVHGILGGVFRTWRQQDKIATLEDKPSNNGRKSQIISNDKNALASKYIFKVPEESFEEARKHLSRFEQEDGKVIYSSEVVDLDPDGEHDETEYTSCWPKYWLPGDCPNARIIAVDFDSFVTHWSGFCPVETTKRSLEDRAKELLEKLHEAGVGKRPIVWVTHSMGGLLAKSILAQAAVNKEYENICKNTKGLVFCSVPHVGSYIALAGSTRKILFMPTEEALELTNSDNSLTVLHERFKKLWRAYQFKVLSFGEMLETTSVFKIAFKMVPFSSADPGIGDFYKVNTNHLNTCKPKSRKSFLYTRIVQLLKKVDADIQKEKKAK